jgi:hypothetical protein
MSANGGEEMRLLAEAGRRHNRCVSTKGDVEGEKT